MASPSNLYAEKIFSEHPIAMWALDDQSDYLSLISDNKRDIFRESPDEDAWTITNGTKSEKSDILNEPMPQISTTEVLPIIGISQTNQITLTSSEIVSPALLNQSFETFAIGAYIFAANPFVLSYEIGYTYDGLTNPVLRKFDFQISDRWVFISETFKIPATTNPIKIIIRINHINSGGDPEDYTFYVNGITFGQWAEDFFTTSKGVYPVELPSNIPFNYPSISAKAYGLQDSDGYYFVNNNSLLAQNAGAPLVYGSSNTTKILPNGNDPSLIIPGQGFLNNEGRYREYTAEMWVRIDSKATSITRIFGPIASSDGIYVEGPFIKIKVGNAIGAHPIGEWYRPMLLDFKVSENSASLLINGEQVISISYSTENLTLPDKTIIQESLEKDQDWLGFYASASVPSLEIDAVAIYPYLVPAIVAKRRFAYGQAVEFPENANSSYRGSSVLIDYSVADYTANYSYPDIGRWGQGIVENLEIDKETLAVPNYKLPEIFFQDNTTLPEWYSDLYDAQSIKPFISFTEKNAYMLFENMNILKQELLGVFGLFSVSEIKEEKQILFKIKNKSNNDYFVSYVINENLIYEVSFNNQVSIIYSEPTIFAHKRFFAGLQIDKFIKYFGSSAAAFFNNKNKNSLYIGGDQSYENTFSGKIYRFNLCSQNDLIKISNVFDDLGLLTYFNYSDIFNDYPEEIEYDAGDIYFQNDPPYENVLDGGSPTLPTNINVQPLDDLIASYSLIPKVEPESFSLDIGIAGYWEDYLPLTYFAQYVSDPFDKKYYDLDFIQFNIDYPALENFTESFYNTDVSLVKSYVSFQYLKTKTSVRSSHLTKISAPKNNVVTPGSEWITSTYEVVDGTVIYMPKGVRITDLSIVTHLEWQIDGIIANPLILKKLEYASEAFNENTSNPVGTKFGTPVFPYLKYGSYFDYKSRNPFRIYKSSTPYLYLTKNSGIQKIGDYDPLVNRGLAIPINQNLSEKYRVVAMQAFLRYGGERFPSRPEQIFEIESKDTYIKFFIVANDNSGKRARIYGINAKTGRFENGIAFYWNGNIVREPVITLGTWNILGISFPNVLDFDSYVGGFRVTGPILINAISHYQSTNLQEIQRQTLRSWFTTQFFNEDIYDWDFWNQSYTWNQVLIFSQSSYFGVNPSDIFKLYTGTNKIIIDDENLLRFKDYRYTAYKNVKWKKELSQPV
jgi:hypothetical protein